MVEHTKSLEKERLLIVVSVEQPRADKIPISQYHESLEIEVKWLCGPQEAGFVSNQPVDDKDVIILEERFQLGKIHKIFFEYAKKLGYDYVMILNEQQYAFVAHNLALIISQLSGNELSYLTISDQTHSSIGLLDYLQKRVFNRRLNLFPVICVYGKQVFNKLPYLFNSDGDIFINEVAIQIVISDLKYLQIQSNQVIHVNLKIKWRTIKVFLAAYFHSLGIFYQNKFDIVVANQQYSLKLGYESSHTYAINAVKAGAAVIDIGAGPFGIGHQLLKKECKVVTVDQFDIPEAYKLHKHIVCNLDHDFDVPIAGYDYILFLDIIEHITNPEKFMFELSKQFGYKKQKVVLTTANISFFPVRLMLLFGYFNYGKSGILDKTHTRLFTFSTFAELVRNGGMKITKIKGIPAPYPKALGNNILSRVMLKVNLLLIYIFRSLFSYQIYIEAETMPSVLYVNHELMKTYVKSESVNESLI